MDIDIMVRLEADLDRIFSTAPRCSGDEAVALRGYPHGAPAEPTGGVGRPGCPTGRVGEEQD